MRRARTVASAIVVALTSACDPGASFKLVDEHKPQEIAWSVADDSVHGRVWASAFIYNFDVNAILNAPADVELLLDSANLAIYGVGGKSFPHAKFENVCDDSVRNRPARVRRCLHGQVELAKIDYDPLDSVTVRFGYAVVREKLVPLTARFVRIW